MSFNHFITFIISLFFLLFGSITLLLPWSETIRFFVIQFIERQIWPWNLFGLGFILIGGALLAQVRFARKRHHYTITIGANSSTLTHECLDEYLRIYWKKLLPKAEVPYKLQLKKNKMQITAKLPFFPQAQQEELLKKIEKDLSALMRDVLGYKQPIDISASFDSKPNH
jgi:hypothetical protein